MLLPGNQYGEANRCWTSLREILTCLRCTRCDRHDESSAIARSYSMGTEEMEAFRSMFREMYHAAVEYRLVGGYKEKRISLSEGLDDHLT